jgi:hypothetical protein
MYWLFFGSLLALISLFALKMYELHAGKLLFGGSARRSLDRFLVSVRNAIASQLTKAGMKSRKILTDAWRHVTAFMSRLLRSLAKRLEQ